MALTTGPADNNKMSSELQAFADVTSRYEFFKETVPAETKTLVQDGGMAWYQFREGPLRTYVEKVGY